VIGKQSRLANVFQSHRLRPFHAREGILVFRGRFHGPKNFCCKTAQFCATRRESEMAEIPNVSNAAQRNENPRKHAFLNYKSKVPFGTTKMVRVIGAKYLTWKGAVEVRLQWRPHLSQTRRNV